MASVIHAVIWAANELPTRMAFALSTGGRDNVRLMDVLSELILTACVLAMVEERSARIVGV
ncbi:hypothetical protein F442_07255 [Phytophthora nicotianae P10297]|nr:hypothetical protein F443_07187 [Phytophthora nicotianae P1569]ETO77549.1 hypothetical protein F444_07260 [Phytophthora nicotianae P1976]ETP46497.1 hypothetical protein F442_07255 [Phytophthora nicotianae P10297]